MNSTPFLLLLSLIVSLNTGMAEEPSWEAYQTVLLNTGPGIKNGVRLNLVDYATIKQHKHLAQAYQMLSSFDTAKLQTREEKLAFYINAYNLLAIKLVVEEWPVASIKDARSLIIPVWYRDAGNLAGKSVSLHRIEHRILRPLGDPRIHMAIVCASVSCPDLRSEPYTAANLSAQLDEQARNFLANPEKGLRIETDAIRISKIFDWFAEDFAADGGVEAFLRRYRSDLPDFPIKADLFYDWLVNGEYGVKKELKVK